MDALFQLVSWRNAAIAGAAYVVYFIALVIYRVFFHPLAKFPGPRRAAATYLYEGYYDVIQNGQYTLKIAELHKEYGPIIRINPNELHVIDPTFYKTIYRQDGIWNKDPYAQGAQPPIGSALATVDHHQHKARRSPLNGFFAKAKVAAHQDILHRHSTILINRIAELADNTDDSEKTFDLGLTASAYTRDIADEYILGQNYHNLDQPDFNAALTNMLQDVGYVWRINKQMPFIYLSTIMFSIPDWLVTPFSDPSTRAFFKYLAKVREISDSAMKDWKKEKLSSSSSPNGDEDDDEDGNGKEEVTTDKKKDKHRTVIHLIMDSDSLPPSDKILLRVWEEMTTITGAAFETTASCLRIIYFHLWSNKAILRRVREELAAYNIPYEISELDVKALEKLPYLTAVICEGLRLSPAIGTRMGRVAPDRDIVYVDNYLDRREAKEASKSVGKEWVIPKGYTVGMTTLLMHLDEELYPNPTEFRPERWIDGPDGANARKIAEANGTFAPFSRGPRICLGMFLAWAEMYVLLAALVQRFDFEFHGAKAEDFLFSSDQFIIGTTGRGVLKATPRRVEV